MITPDQFIANLPCTCKDEYKSKGEIDPACLLHNKPADLNKLLEDYARAKTVEHVHMSKYAAANKPFTPPPARKNKGNDQTGNREAGL